MGKATNHPATTASNMPLSEDDFDVIVFKILSYAYACVRGDVLPYHEKAYEIAGCNFTYFKAATLSMLNDGFINEECITQTGATYLRDDNNMAKVKSFLGGAWDSVVDDAVQATRCIKRNKCVPSGEKR